jgi:hypothetical protein
VRRGLLGLALLAALVTCASGCVRHYAYSVSGGTSFEGKRVNVEGGGVGLLWLTAPDLDASDELQRKCPSGKLSNVVSQATVRDWFWTVQVYEVYVRGVCND